MRVKDTYFIYVWDDSNPSVVGVGECNLFKGLSSDDVPDYENVLQAACDSSLQEIPDYSSIKFGIECALANLATAKKDLYFPSAWTNGKIGIKINGLVWMGAKSTMRERIKQKLETGFSCVKLKIGGIDFDDEIDLLRYIRSQFGNECLELRLDANGAFPPDQALSKLERLSRFGIHSIEQPIKAGQPESMAKICSASPIPIALDEELIGVRSIDEKRELLSLIKPNYIILKPALCGGLAHSDEWIKSAQELNIGWWATSALESNIGLNAIAQWLSCCQPDALDRHHGLGTGTLYSNNIYVPISLIGKQLWFKE